MLYLLTWECHEMVLFEYLPFPNKESLLLLLAQNQNTYIRIIDNEFFLILYLQHIWSCGLHKTNSNKV